MRRLVWIVLLGALTGCAGGEDRAAPPSAPPDPGVRPTAAEVEVQRVPRELGSLPRLRSALPRDVPTDVGSVPRLLDDLPGAATMAYHPPEWLPGEPSGWASETMLFHGVDGRWRRLRMDELGLPETTWPGDDTYGAGSLSPDGRRWAAQTLAGVIVLDLRTGRMRTIDLGSGSRVGTIWVEWRPDGRSLVADYWDHGHRTALITLPSWRPTTLPYRAGQARQDPAGTPWSVRYLGRNRVEVFRWEGGKPVSLGTVTVPGTPRRGRLWSPPVTHGRLLPFVQPESARTLDLVVIQTDPLTVEARLHLGHREHVSGQHANLNARWLDPDTVLFTTRRTVLAWRPLEGRFLRVTALPDPGPGWATIDVAADAARHRVEH